LKTIPQWEKLTFPQSQALNCGDFPSPGNHEPPHRTASTRGVPPLPVIKI